MAGLGRGDSLPRIEHPPPGPESRRMARLLERYEAPGINTLGPDGVSLVWQEARGANVLAGEGHGGQDVFAVVRHQYATSS